MSHFLFLSNNKSSRIMYDLNLIDNDNIPETDSFPKGNKLFTSNNFENIFLV